MIERWGHANDIFKQKVFFKELEGDLELQGQSKTWKRARNSETRSLKPIAQTNDEKLRLDEFR